MFENKEGQRIPEVVLTMLDGSGMKKVETAEFFAGRTVIVFGLPGAFTPTCSTSHVPRYNQLAPVFAEHGVDEIVCVSVNDGFVMSAWAVDQSAENVTMWADGNGAFTEAMGLLVDKSDLGFGKRSWRYSMLVKDGVIEKQFIEPEVPGDPFQVSDADTMLAHIAPNAEAPHDIFMLTKPGCSHCARAKSMLSEAGLAYEAIDANLTMLRAVSATSTTPRVFVDGQLVGGAEELAEWIAAR